MLVLLLTFGLLILVGCPTEDDSLSAPEIDYVDSKNGNVTVAWYSVKNAEAYALVCTYVRGLPVNEYEEGGGTASTSGATSFTFDSRWVKVGATYSFKVRAVRQTGGLKTSEWTDTGTVTVKN
jgi:hypothetical protein